MTPRGQAWTIAASLEGQNENARKGAEPPREHSFQRLTRAVFLLATEMGYKINGEKFSSKDAIRKRCRAICLGTIIGKHVTGDDEGFLLELFSHHDGWTKKTNGCQVKLSVWQVPSFGTLGILITRQDGTSIDVSYRHAIECLTNRDKAISDRPLKNYKAAARFAILEQVLSFKTTLDDDTEVDHQFPFTFERLLWDFTNLNRIDPWTVNIGSDDGVSCVFIDPGIENRWREYHHANAVLRLLSKSENAKQPRVFFPWMDLKNAA